MTDGTFDVPDYGLCETCPKCNGATPETQDEVCCECGSNGFVKVKEDCEHNLPKDECGECKADKVEYLNGFKRDPFKRDPKKPQPKPDPISDEMGPEPEW